MLTQHPPAPPPAGPAPPAPTGFKQEVPLKDKKPIGFMLVGRQVVPLTEPYFRIVQRGFIRDSTGNLLPAAQVKRVQDGHPIETALHGHGIIEQAMANGDSRIDAFFFLVCADAIDSFNLVRWAVYDKGFAYGWRTFQDKDFTISGGQPGQEFTGVAPLYYQLLSDDRPISEIITGTGMPLASSSTPDDREPESLGETSSAAERIVGQASLAPISAEILESHRQTTWNPVLPTAGDAEFAGAEAESGNAPDDDDDKRAPAASGSRRVVRRVSFWLAGSMLFAAIAILSARIAYHGLKAGTASSGYLTNIPHMFTVVIPPENKAAYPGHGPIPTARQTQAQAQPTAPSSMARASSPATAAGPNPPHDAARAASIASVPRLQREQLEAQPVATGPGPAKPAAGAPSRAMAPAAAPPPGSPSRAAGPGKGMSPSGMKRSEPAVLSKIEAEMLVSRGDEALAMGDVTTARLFYRRGADGGDSTAALRLGATFDPAFLAQAQVGRVAGDPAMALYWYRRAHDLGNSDADLVLKSFEPAK